MHNVTNTFLSLRSSAVVSNTHFLLIVDFVWRILQAFLRGMERKK